MRTVISYFCHNNDCEDYGKEKFFPDLVYVMRDGKLVPKKPLLCDKCHQEVEQRYTHLDDDDEPLRLNFSRFGSMSNEDKKKWIQDRNKQVAKKDAELKEHYTKKVLGIKE